MAQSKRLILSTRIEKEFIVKIAGMFLSMLVPEGTIIVNRRDAKIIYSILKAEDSKTYYRKKADEDIVMS